MLKLLYIFVLKKTVNAVSFFMQLFTLFFFFLEGCQGYHLNDTLLLGIAKQ